MRTRVLTLTIIAVLAVSPAVSIAQPLSQPHLSMTAPRTTLHSGLQSFTSSGTLRTLVIGGLLTGLATQYDNHSAAAFRNPPGPASTVLDAGDDFGNGAYLMAASATAWGTGLLLRSDGLKTTGRSLVLGLAAEGLVVTSIKQMVRRKRPDGSDLRSFPSGHTAGAFTAATVLSRRHGWRVGLPAYTLAAITAMDRMEDKKHFASDVVAGAVLGIVIGRAVTATADQSDSRLKLVPAGLGAKLTLSF